MWEGTLNMYLAPGVCCRVLTMNYYINTSRPSWRHDIFPICPMLKPSQVIFRAAAALFKQAQIMPCCCLNTAELIETKNVLFSSV